MVNITLTNRNLHSPDRQVVINIATGSCVFSDKREIELKQLITETNFIHPLISEPFTPASDYIFHYEYDNIEGLLYSAIYVYSTLLHVDKPAECKFKINPSLRFQRAKFAEAVYFSIHPHKFAQESIRIRQLEALVSQLSGFKFEFSEDIFIDDQLT